MYKSGNYRGSNNGIFIFINDTIQRMDEYYDNKKSRIEKLRDMRLLSLAINDPAIAIEIMTEEIARLYSDIDSNFKKDEPEVEWVNPTTFEEMEEAIKKAESALTDNAE